MPAPLLHLGLLDALAGGGGIADCERGRGGSGGSARDWHIDREPVIGHGGCGYGGLHGPSELFIAGQDIESGRPWSGTTRASKMPPPGKNPLVAARPGLGGGSPLGSRASAPNLAASRQSSVSFRCIGYKCKRAQRYSPIFSRRKPKLRSRPPGRSSPRSNTQPSQTSLDQPRPRTTRCEPVLGP